MDSTYEKKELHGYIKHGFVILHEVIYDVVNSIYEYEECAINPDYISCVVPEEHQHVGTITKCYFSNRTERIKVYESMDEVLEILNECKKKNRDITIHV